MNAEADRVAELLRRAELGRASDAETEELALYAADDSAVKALVEQAVRNQTLGEGWLARIDADQALAQAERSRWPERAAGLGLLAVGYGLSLFAPALGLGLLGLGMIVLLVSFIGMRLRHRDPYDSVQQ